MQKIKLHKFLNTNAAIFDNYNTKGMTKKHAIEILQISIKVRDLNYPNDFRKLLEYYDLLMEYFKNNFLTETLYYDSLQSNHKKINEFWDFYKANNMDNIVFNVIKSDPFSLHEPLIATKFNITENDLI
jgi:hypothetical protein